MALRNALVDLSNISAPDADIFDYLEPRTVGIMSRLAAKPDSIDPFDDASIDTTKWATHGTVTETSFLGVDGLEMTTPATPGYDDTGVIYKPPIAASIGRQVIIRSMSDRPVEFLHCLQEYDFTVDSIVTPTTWDLKYTTAPQDLRNSMGLRWAPGALYFFEGGAAGSEEYVSELPSRLSESGKIYPLQTVFVFNSTGWDIYAHIPGIWASPKLVKTYDRPGGSHNANGYSMCVNKYTADDVLHFYALAWYFKSNVSVTGGRMTVANTTDKINVGSIQVPTQLGVNAGQSGNILVRVPDYSSSLLTLEELAEVTDLITGKQVYDIDFELNQDIALLHPVRFTVDDMTLPTEASAEGE
jgi:hypothetical protein